MSLHLTIHWQEGPTTIGALELGEGVAMVLPRTVQTIASVQFASGAHLKMSPTAIITGHCEVLEGATLERLPTTS